MGSARLSLEKGHQRSRHALPIWIHMGCVSDGITPWRHNLVLIAHCEFRMATGIPGMLTRIVFSFDTYVRFCSAFSVNGGCFRSP